MADGLRDRRHLRERAGGALDRAGRRAGRPAGARAAAGGRGRLAPSQAQRAAERAAPRAGLGNLGALRLAEDIYPPHPEEGASACALGTNKLCLAPVSKDGAAPWFETPRTRL